MIIISQSKKKKWKKVEKTDSFIVFLFSKQTIANWQHDVQLALHSQPNLVPKIYDDNVDLRNLQNLLDRTTGHNWLHH